MVDSSPLIRVSGSIPLSLLYPYISTPIPLPSIGTGILLLCTGAGSRGMEGAN